jgi:hypothetical protein
MVEIIHECVGLDIGRDAPEFVVLPIAGCLFFCYHCKTASDLYS